MLGGSPNRGIPKLSVDSILVVVVDVFAEQAMQVPLAHDDHVIQQLPTSAADPSLGNPVLPWTSKGRSFSLLIDDHRNGLGADIDSDEVELFHPLLPGTL